MEWNGVYGIVEVPNGNEISCSNGSFLESSPPTVTGSIPGRRDMSDLGPQDQDGDDLGQVSLMLRIRDILVPIRIRGSVHLTSGSGSCYFHP
jgi:hypothetical protein